MVSASSGKPQAKQEQQTRREELQKAQDAIKKGAAFAKQIETGKRLRDDMDEDEQQALDDYETGRAKRAKRTNSLPVLKPFRSQ